jgi:hypothetical protein
MTALIVAHLADVDEWGVSYKDRGRAMAGENELSRRQFGAALAASALAARAPANQGFESRRGRPVEEAAPIKARPFPLKQVRLLSGSCYTLQDRNRAYLHTLDSDRLLHTFRLTAGLLSKARQLGGWDRPDIELHPAQDHGRPAGHVRALW